MGSSRRLLLAAVSEADRRMLFRLLSSEPGWEVLEAATGAQALQRIEESGASLDLALLGSDLSQDGEAVANRLRAMGDPCAPVVLLSPRDRRAGEALPWEALSSEVLEMPPEPAAALRRVRVMLELREYRRGGRPLPGLLSGEQMAEAVDRALREGKKEGVRAALLSIALDDVPQAGGREGGGLAEQALANAVRTAVKLLPEGAPVGGLEGARFFALLFAKADRREIVRQAEVLKQALRHRYSDAPEGLKEASVSIGAASYPEDGRCFAELSEAALSALRAVRDSGPGRNALLFFTPEMRKARRNAERCKRALVSEGEAGAAYRDVFTPVVCSRDDEIFGYDYTLLPSEMRGCTLDDVIRQLRHLPSETASYLFKAAMRQAFSTLHGLAAQGVALPNISLYIALPFDEVNTIICTLRDMLRKYPISAGLVCVNIPQEAVLAMSQARVRSFVREMRALGFSTGIYHVGHQVIPSVCLDGMLFDRVLFSPAFVRDLLQGVYPPAFAQWILPYFNRTGTVVCFPVELHETERARLLALTQSNLCSYRAELRSTEAFCAHLKENPRREIPPRAARRAVTFRMGLEQYEEILQKSGVLIFDWQPHSESVVFSQTVGEVYDASAFDGRPALSALVDVLHPDDRARFRGLLLALKHGQTYGEAVFRSCRGSAEQQVYRWRRCTLLSVPDERGVTAHVYGISFDVDRERQEAQDFKRRAETDPLTGLLNRGGTESYIQDFLSGAGRVGHHALMLIDVDNFKMLNDRQGHLVGDEALRRVSAGLKALFRVDDVVGRIGGDEFVVFIKNIQSKESIATRAEHVGRVFRETDAEWNISATIGVTRYPDDGHTFQEMYAKADIALYNAKSVGKDQWTIYSGR